MTEQYVIGAFIGWAAHAWFARVRDRVVAKQRAERIARGLEKFNQVLQETTEKMKAAQAEKAAANSPFVQPIRRRGR